MNEQETLMQELAQNVSALNARLEEFRKAPLDEETWDKITAACAAMDLAESALFLHNQDI